MTNGIGRVGWRTFVPTNNPLWDNLKAYYTGDNTTINLKSSVQGTLVNGATYSTGKIGSAFSFDGVNDYMSTTETLSIDLNQPHTYSCWVNLSSGYSTKFFMSFLSMYGPSIGHTNGGVLTFFSGNVNGQVGSGAILPLNTWSHVVVVFKGRTYGTGNVLFYVNGNLVSTTSLGFGNIIPTVPLTIGSRNVEGKLDECAIWSRELTASEVTELYNGGAGKQYVAPVPTYPIITNGLSLYYDISNPLSYAGSGTTLNDLSGNANTATLYNGVGYSSSNGGILTLDGINDYISAPHSTSLVKTSTGALFIWVKLNVAAPFRGVLVAKGDVINNRSSYGILQYDYQEIVSICSASTNQELGISYPPSTWRQIGLVWNGSTIKKYVNGVEVASVNQTINVNDIGSILRIGQYVNMNFGELYLYNTITPTQITSNFNATKSRYGL
jgi:hypothetical protein